MDMNLVLTSIGVFLTIIMILVAILLVAKAYLSPSGNVNVTINGKDTLSVPQGASLLSTLSQEGIFLPSACGGKGSCGQCKLQVTAGGGEILDSEKGHFTRKQIKDHWRLGCQCKVKGDLEVKVDDSVMGVKEWECTVIGNKNVATFIKEYKVALPAGEHMDFEPGSYAQIKIPAFDCIDYDKDFDKSLIGDTYLPAWEKFGLFPLKCKNPQETIRAYSMANYPDEGDIITLNVRIATPPFKPKEQGPGFMDVNPGIASSYIFSLKPGDKVIMSGPYGEFRPQYGTGREMIVEGSRREGRRPSASHALLLWRTCSGGDSFPRRLPAAREGLPQLPLPLGARPSRPEGRCSRHQVHAGLRGTRHGRHLPQGTRGSRGLRVLPLRTSNDGKDRARPLALSRCRGRHDPLRQLRRITNLRTSIKAGFPTEACFVLQRRQPNCQTRRA